MPHPSGLTCIHAPAGLCPACTADFDADWSAWHEYGLHAAGGARWQALREEMAAEARGAMGTVNAGIPF